MQVYQFDDEAKAKPEGWRLHLLSSILQLAYSRHATTIKFSFIQEDDKIHITANFDGKVLHYNGTPDSVAGSASYLRNAINSSAGATALVASGSVFIEVNARSFSAKNVPQPSDVTMVSISLSTDKTDSEKQWEQTWANFASLCSIENLNLNVDVASVPTTRTIKVTSGTLSVNLKSSGRVRVIARCNGIPVYGFGNFGYQPSENVALLDLTDSKYAQPGNPRQERLGSFLNNDLLLVAAQAPKSLLPINDGSFTAWVTHSRTLWTSSATPSLAPSQLQSLMAEPELSKKATTDRYPQNFVVLNSSDLSSKDLIGKLRNEKVASMASKWKKALTLVLSSQVASTFGVTHNPGKKLIWTIQKRPLFFGYVVCSKQIQSIAYRPVGYTVLAINPIASLNKNLKALLLDAAYCVAQELSTSPSEQSRLASELYFSAVGGN